MNQIKIKNTIYDEDEIVKIIFLRNKYKYQLNKTLLENEELKHRLKHEFDTGYKMGVGEGIAELDRLRKQIQEFREKLAFYS